MQLILNEIEPEARIVISPRRRMTEDEFWNFCQNNPDLRIERTAEGKIEIMPPTGIETGDRSLMWLVNLQTGPSATVAAGYSIRTRDSFCQTAPPAHQMLAG